MTPFDLTEYRVVTADDLDRALRAGASEVTVREGAILTPSARDIVAAKGISLKFFTPGSGAASGDKWQALFHSPEAEKVKAEIVAVGRKLWKRQYVDGNGGNISYRLTEEAVLCTPTLVSKADLTPDDLCLVDLTGKQLAGGKPRTSEILMHLEIYKSVPEAKAVAHCHPPHATAYAITGRVPPTCVIPEFEVFVGKLALTPYETPGTQKFAETVVPVARDHNTILLANHGIVCWADTVTHAEWYVEVVDTYCWTLMLAAQLGAPLTHFGEEKASDLLAIKQKLGLPDERLLKECQLCDLPEQPGGIAIPPSACAQGAAAGAPPEDLESIVQAVTDAVMAALEKSKS
ncbi:MAG TPA: class II aldolase/adducin family protein [Bryobacteraceae bacterium]|nr:class II aldolase/adducin family protein [Bryobacteraceae bacterium]